MAALTLKLSEGTLSVMTPATTDISLLETLQGRGYEPQDDPRTPGESFDLIASGIGSVRVVIFPRDAGRVDIHKLNGYTCEEWTVRFCPNTPDAVIIATLDAAEAQLAAQRGGPVR